ncbi:MAG: N-acetylmuramoyl-L-alanine amidase [Candidatus Margulisbacteria bacterium]|nr:N-acetylmuramoyl-L-alanine amidase [Candidatus Margulisiibacteriota bacterium]
MYNPSPTKLNKRTLSHPPSSFGLRRTEGGEGRIVKQQKPPSPFGRRCQSIAQADEGWRLFLFTAFWILSLSACSFADELKLLRIEASRSLGNDYLDIYTTGLVETRGLLLEKELQIDFPGVLLDKNVEITAVKSKRVAKISAIQADPQTVRVIIALKKAIDYNIAHIFGRDKTVVEIGDRRDFTAELMAAWEKKALAEKGDPIKAFEFAPAGGVNLSLQGKTVILDPGHGGNDSGAIAPCGLPEKNLTLLTARKTAELLSAAGAKVYLTRNVDRKNNLKDIVDYVNRTKADIFISLHYNFCGKSDIGGTETYYYNANSRPLALNLHRSLLYGLKRKDRGLRKQIFYTVHHSQIPAALLEPLFLSNQEEEKLAFTPDFQALVAQSIFTGVKNYFRSN